MSQVNKGRLGHNSLSIQEHQPQKSCLTINWKLTNQVLIKWQWFMPCNGGWVGAHADAWTFKARQQCRRFALVLSLGLDLHLCKAGTQGGIARMVACTTGWTHVPGLGWHWHKAWDNTNTHLMVMFVAFQGRKCHFFHPLTTESVPITKINGCRSHLSADDRQAYRPQPNIYIHLPAFLAGASFYSTINSHVKLSWWNYEGAN
jgi:hypothetical protein